ncbi:MAG: diguanylate cyclase/phosphodiesterase [Mycobacterium sp.]|nr:diguanylate cyclase/phosphodiesterase [Mycobacterium sp.]
MVATGRYAGAVAWLPDGTIAYAAEPGRTGTHEKARPELQAAMHGEMVTAVVTAPLAGVPDPTERRALTKVGSVLEIFAPITIDGKVVASVQLYQPWHTVEETIARQTRTVLLSILAGLAVLWLGLFSLVLSASRKVREQSAANLHLASHDSLTGLANRSLLREHVESALDALPWSGRRMGLILLDLDRFKEVNDTLGHHYGDELLMQIGPRLKVALRQGDSVARLGGDEFVVVLAELDSVAEAVAIAERMKLALDEPFVVDTFTVEVQASIGIAISPDDGDDFDTLLQHADIAMYTAKSSHSYIAVYSADTDNRTPSQLERIGQVRRAVGLRSTEDAVIADPDRDQPAGIRRR